MNPSATELPPELVSVLQVAIQRTGGDVQAGLKLVANAALASFQQWEPKAGMVSVRLTMSEERRAAFVALAERLNTTVEKLFAAALNPETIAAGFGLSITTIVEEARLQ